LIDPESGLVLEDGCYPQYGNPVQEVFLAEFEPATTCPRRGDYNIFEAIGDWLGDVFGGPEDVPEPDPGVTANGTRDVLGSGKLKNKPKDGTGRRAEVY
jgi:hypothetical protein